jgi:hypothetical protein
VTKLDYVNNLLPKHNSLANLKDEGETNLVVNYCVTSELVSISKHVCKYLAIYWLHSSASALLKAWLAAISNTSV